MKWVSSNNTKNQLRFEFNNKQDAIDFATKNQYQFKIIEPQEPKIIFKSYADNFTN
jgi:NADH dehydrogenase (ubiquinone) Fe-S protein 4